MKSSKDWEFQYDGTWKEASLVTSNGVPVELRRRRLSESGDYEWQFRLGYISDPQNEAQRRANEMRVAEHAVWKRIPDHLMYDARKAFEAQERTAKEGEATP